MENYKINPKLKIYEDIKNIYYAKPDKTLAQHNEELHIQKKKLIDLGYINDNKIIELLEYSIEFHDIGKINPEFQVRVKENKKFDTSKEVAHNILSIHFIDKKDYDDKNDFESIVYAVFYHHRFGNGDNDSIRADENTKKIIENLLEKIDLSMYKFARFCRNKDTSVKFNSDEFINYQGVDFRKVSYDNTKTSDNDKFILFSSIYEDDYVSKFKIKDFVILKKKSSYIPLNVFSLFPKKEDLNLDKLLIKLYVWILETKTGDFSELNLLYLEKIQQELCLAF